MKAVIGLNTIDRLQIYVAKRQKTIASIKAETKADYIINGGLFDMNYNDSPNCWLRVDGKTLHTDRYGYWCYGWDTSDIKIIHSANITTVRNAICATTLLKDGGNEPLVYKSDLWGTRGRSCIGMTKDSLVLYCSADGTSGAMTPEKLREYMRSLGCQSAIMLDSGGSSSGDFLGQRVTTSRKCHNYILVYLKKDRPVVGDTCPYAEPRTAIRSMSRGEGAKWAQWHLNRHGASLVIDGSFGPASVVALKAFQKSNGLTADGSCGPATRAKLKEFKMATAQDLLKVAIAEIGVKESPANSNRVKYNTEYYGRVVSGSDYLWCVVFVWSMFKKAGMSNLFYGGGKTASCSTLNAYHKAKGQSVPIGRWKPGDLIFFNFKGKTSTQHIGICESYDGTYITTIDGNTGTTSEDNGGAVMRRKRDKKYVVSAIRPKYDGTDSKVDAETNYTWVQPTAYLPVLQYGAKNMYVSALQSLLNGLGHDCGTVDGSYGPKVLSAVKAFQKAQGISVDGSVGKETWSRLLVKR